MVKSSSLLAFLGLIGLGLTTVSNAASFQNGSFENGVDPPTSSYLNIWAGDSHANDITGWVVSAGRIDWMGASSQTPKDGSLSVELDGLNSAISQTFTTIPGQSYEVTFSLLEGFGMDYEGGYVDNVDVSLGGSTAHETLNKLGGQWYDFSETLLADSTSSTLTFTCVGLSAYYNSPFLDAVTVTAVPGVPDGGLTIAMLGMAVSGLAFIRRKL